MLSGKTPFSCSEDVIQNTISMKPYFSIKAKDLLTELLCKDPKGRLCSAGGSREIKDHPFYSNLNWNEMVENKEITASVLMSKSNETSENKDEIKDAEMPTIEIRESCFNLTYAQSPELCPSIPLDYNSPQNETIDESPEREYI